MLTHSHLDPQRWRVKTVTLTKVAIANIIVMLNVVTEKLQNVDTFQCTKPIRTIITGQNVDCGLNVIKVRSLVTQRPIAGRNTYVCAFVEFPTIYTMSYVDA
jgi:hypothetical protein